MSVVISTRMAERDEQKLRRRAAQSGRKVSELAGRYIHEGLIGEEYPGIVFINGPAGRRAHVSGLGLDVWEVVLNIEGGFTVEEFAKERTVSAGTINTALDYARDHRDEIDPFMPPELPPDLEAKIAS